MTTSRFVFDQALRLLDKPFPQLAPWRAAGSSKVDEITSPLTERWHIGDFFRAFIDQQNHQHYFGMVRRNQNSRRSASNMVLPARGGRND